MRVNSNWPCEKLHALLFLIVIIKLTIGDERQGLERKDERGRNLRGKDWRGRVGRDLY
jgi:hypothetical protein